MNSLMQLSQQFKSLRFNAMAEHLEALIKQAEDNDISYLQFTSLLVETELGSREKRRIQLNRKKAGFPTLKRLDEFDFRFQTTVTKKQIQSLLDFRFIDERENIVFIGPPGVGKTHLGISIGSKAIDAGYKVWFTSALELVELLEIAEIKGGLKKKITALCKFDLIIIDELGYLPLNKQGMFNLFQFINTLYEYRSVIITTNKDFTNWNDFFVDENVAVPVIDRLIHHSHLFMMGGESYRLKNKLNR